MAKYKRYEWSSAHIRRNGNIIDLGDGAIASVSNNEQLRTFMKKAGKNGRAFRKGIWILLYYNSETGDIFISKEEEILPIDEVKRDFLRFISKDDHEDVKFKEVIIKE